MAEIRTFTTGGRRIGLVDCRPPNGAAAAWSHSAAVLPALDSLVRPSASVGDRR